MVDDPLSISRVRLSSIKSALLGTQMLLGSGDNVLMHAGTTSAG